MKIEITNHCKERMHSRKIEYADIKEAIERPDNLMKKENKYYYQKRIERGTIEVVCEKSKKSLNVITTYWI